MDSGASEGKVFQIKSSTPLIFLFSSIACIMWKNVSSYALRQIEKSSFFQSLNSNVPKCVFGCSSERPILLKTEMANSIISKRSLCCTGCVWGYYECSALWGLWVKRNLPSFPMFLLYQSMFFFETIEGSP